MRSFDGGTVRSHESEEVHVPSSCPSCQSTSVKTTAKNPDASSYWRCERCGEVWNVGRRHDVRSVPRAWR